MDVCGPLRAALFFYELLRFGALVSLLALTGPPGGEEFFPYLAYLAPNALFLLMTLFVWLRPRDYAAYLPLYGAGKLLTVIAFGGWCAFSFKAVLKSFLFMRPELAAALGGAFLCSLADVFAFAGGMVLMKRINRAFRPPEPALPAEVVSGEASGGPNFQGEL